MIDSLVYMPNKVPQKQAALQNDARFIWQKMPRANLYYRGYLVLLGSGLLGSTYGIISMIRGIKN